MIKLTVIIFIFLLSGCVTPYQKLGAGGGYQDIQLAKDIYKVSFRGNAATSQEMVQNYLLRRSADLTLQNGYKYFLILASRNNDDVIPVVTPTKIRMDSFGSFNGAGNVTGNTIGNNFYGNMSVYGNTNQFTTGTIQPGQTYIYHHYATIVIIKMLKSNKKAPLAFDAEKILSSFKTDN